MQLIIHTACIMHLIIVIYAARRAIILLSNRQMSTRARNIILINNYNNLFIVRFLCGSGVHCLLH